MSTGVGGAVGVAGRCRTPSLLSTRDGAAAGGVDGAVARDVGRPVMVQSDALLDVVALRSDLEGNGAAIRAVDAHGAGVEVVAGFDLEVHALDAQLRLGYHEHVVDLLVDGVVVAVQRGESNSAGADGVHGTAIAEAAQRSGRGVGPFGDVRGEGGDVERGARIEHPAAPVTEPAL